MRNELDTFVPWDSMSRSDRVLISKIIVSLLPDFVAQFESDRGRGPRESEEDCFVTGMINGILNAEMIYSALKDVSQVSWQE